MASATASEDIPGMYGLGIARAIKDRYDYFVKEGPEECFKSRMMKYKSSVYRVNLPPGPPLFPEAQAIVLLDSKSFRVLFDMTKVEKRNVFIGNYIPSSDFTGSFKVLSYMDPSKEHHANLNKFCSDILKMNAHKWFPEFHKGSEEPSLHNNLWIVSCMTGMKVEMCCSVCSGRMALKQKNPLCTTNSVQGRTL